MDLNQDFLIETFFSYCKRPLYKKYQNIFNAECPVCKEGKSTGRSRRLFYFPLKNYLYCHNCCKSWSPFDWVKEVTSLTVPEILKRNRDKTTNSVSISGSRQVLSQPIEKTPNDDLPLECIDLTNPVQLEFYRDNNYVNSAFEYCINRRLFTAVNTCGKFYISLNDKIHKNRLIIPFFQNTKIVCYQSRALTNKQFPKYLTKFGEKEIFGIDNIKSDIPYIFIFEGPIDSMFVQNGIALAALIATEHQQNIINSLLGYEIIYVFDNDKNNPQTAARIEKYIKNGKTVFIWPNEFKKFKDFNEICSNLRIDEIPWKFVSKNSYKGPEALIKFKLSSHILGTKG